MENICKNCKRFVPYYILLSATFSKTVRGHWLNSKPAKKGKKTISEDCHCEKFEAVENSQKDLQQNLNYCIREIQRKLDYIAFILSEK